MDIACRVDSSTDIGSGHIMRCLTLAEGLRKKNSTVTFICRELPGHLGDLVVEKGFILKLLPRQTFDFDCQPNTWLKVNWEVDVNETIAAIGSKIDLLIIDHYGIDDHWHRKASFITSKIMVIDDLANRLLYCDILLDQTFERKEIAYLPLVRSETILLCGSKYALLREQFSKNRAAAIDKRAKFNGIKQILINFGGVDLANKSGQVLSLLSKIELTPGPRVEIVLGKKPLYLDKIKRQAEDYKLNVKILSYVENMSALILKADIAIGAGGSTSWERCTLGLPALIFVDADNQLLIAQNLEKAGAVNVIDRVDNKIIKTLLELNANINKYSSLSRAAFRICDGLGVNRVINEITGLSF